MLKRAFPLLLVLAALPGRAAVLLVGEELTVKSGRPNNEHSPAVSFAPDGHGLIVWTDSRDGLRGRFIGADGALAAQDLLLVKNQHLTKLPGEGTEIYRKDPALLLLADGSFWLYWTEETQHVVIDFFDERHEVIDRDVRGQRFDAAGLPLGGSLLVNTAPSGFQSRPQVQALPCAPPLCSAQHFVLAWESDDRAPQSGAGEGIVAQLFDLQAVPLSAQVRLSPPSPAQNVALAPGPEGGLLAAWEAPEDANVALSTPRRQPTALATPRRQPTALAMPRTVLRARFFDAGLQPLGRAFALSPKTPGAQRRVSLVWNDVAGEATAVFDRTMHWTGRSRVMAQRLAAPARVLGGPLAVSSGVAEGPSTSVLTSGNTVLVLWVSWKGGYPFVLQGKELGDKTGAAAAEFPIAQYPRYDLTVTAAPDGRLLAVWEGYVNNYHQGIAARWLQRVF